MIGDGSDEDQLDDGEQEGTLVRRSGTSDGVYSRHGEFDKSVRSSFYLQRSTYHTDLIVDLIPFLRRWGLGSKLWGGETKRVKKR